MLSYDEFLQKESFSQVELLAYSKGNLVTDPPKQGLAQLPSPPFLMFDEIVELVRGQRRGMISARQTIRPDLWFFQCHFGNDPVQPGCLGVDAIWQLLGFYCCLNGATGSGRALGCKEVEFFGQIRPFDKVVSYHVDVKRLSKLKGSGQTVVVGSGTVLVDGVEIYRITDAKVGVFQDIAYHDYPNPDSANARGGVLS